MAEVIDRKVRADCGDRFVLVPLERDVILSHTPEEVGQRVFRPMGRVKRKGRRNPRSGRVDVGRGTDHSESGHSSFMWQVAVEGR